MSEQQVQNILYVVGGILAIGGTVLSGLLLWAAKKFFSTAFDLVVEMKLLRKDMAEVKEYGPRIFKLEKDTNEAHAKIRGLEQS